MTDDKLVLAGLSKVIILMFAAVTYLHFNIHYFISVISSLHFPGPICLGVSKRGRKQEDNCYSGKARRKRCLQISLNEKERNWPEGSPEHIFKSQQAFAKVCSYLISPIPVEIKYLYRKNSTLCFFKLFSGLTLNLRNLS